MNRRECLKRLGLAGGVVLAGSPRSLFGQASSLPRLAGLRAEAERLGKPGWRAMLRYHADLHAKAIKPAQAPFPFPWEEIGPGYMSRAFGHWDIVHEMLDVLPAEPDHVRHQLSNDLVSQQQDGFLPGSIYVSPTGITFGKEQGHPPLWPVAADDYARQQKDPAVLATCFEPLVRQIHWFETNRKAEGEGAYYADILTGKWESGVDEGVRFTGVTAGNRAFVDATAHLYQMYALAAAWAKTLGKSAETLDARATTLRDFLRTKLYVETTGLFHDLWAVENPAQRIVTFEGLWPMIVGAATPQQATRIVEGSLLNPDRFLCAHPIATVGLKEKAFELRMWRGPAWNSMTYWAARGALRYGFKAAAKTILEWALDDTAAQFARTGTIWEFYSPSGGKPEELRRKLVNQRWTNPCRDYLGHNPLFAMARLWQDAG